jgi:hypothetical protein
MREAVPEPVSGLQERCPQCGARLSAGPGGESCARCLLALGLDAGPGLPAGEQAESDAQPPAGASTPDKGGHVP